MLRLVLTWIHLKGRSDVRGSVVTECHRIHHAVEGYSKLPCATNSISLRLHASSSGDFNIEIRNVRYPHKTVLVALIRARTKDAHAHDPS